MPAHAVPVDLSLKIYTYINERNIVGYLRGRGNKKS